MVNITWFKHYRQFVMVKVAANLRSEASRNYLSYLWWVFEPSLQIAIFYLVFGFLLKRGTEDYIVFLVCGVIPWAWFYKSVNNSMNSIIQGRGLMRQVHLPKILLPIIVICQDAVKQSVVVVLLLFFLFIYGIEPSPFWCFLPVLMIVQFLLIAACAFAAAAVVPFLPDISFLIKAGLSMLMFCSGVFYSVERLPIDYRPLFMLNPMANLLTKYRDILLYNRMPDLSDVFYISAGSILAIFFMTLIITRIDHIYPRVVL